MVAYLGDRVRAKGGRKIYFYFVHFCRLITFCKHLHTFCKCYCYNKNYIKHKETGVDRRLGKKNA